MLIFYKQIYKQVTNKMDFYKNTNVHKNNVNVNVNVNVKWVNFVRTSSVRKFVWGFALFGEIKERYDDWKNSEICTGYKGTVREA